MGHTRGGPPVYTACQHAAVRLIESPNTWRVYYHAQPLRARKMCGIRFCNIFLCLYSTSGQLSNLRGMRFLHFLIVSTQNPKDLEKSTNNWDPYAGKAFEWHKELSPYIYTECSLQDPRKTLLRSCRNNHRPIPPAGTSMFSTREVDSGHLADARHRGKLFCYDVGQSCVCRCHSQAGLSGGQRGQLPRALRCKGAPVTKFICFK